jgi:L-threonylcarbamoyladenylate synthase
MGEIMKIDPINPSPERIEEVAKLIRGGGVVIYPTETLYGLGANPFSPRAVMRLYEIKGREECKPIPFLIKDLQMLTIMVQIIPPLGKTLIQKYWPGPLTLIFWAKEDLHAPLRGRDGKIGLRISSHPIARMIVETLNTPLTSTSANPSGGEDLIDTQKISHCFSHQVDLIIDGGEVLGVGSTVVDLTEIPPVIVREGVIRRHVLKEELDGAIL